MATKKEIALWAAFNMGHIFRQNMQVVKMNEDSIQELQIRHICLPGQGLNMLQRTETMLQDYLKYYHILLWGCPHCGKLYWYIEEVGQVLGEEAIMLRRQKKILEMNGYATQQIPNQSFYNVVMTEPDMSSTILDTQNSTNWLEEDTQTIDDIDDKQEDIDEDTSNELDKFNDIDW